MGASISTKPFNELLLLKYKHVSTGTINLCWYVILHEFVLNLYLLAAVLYCFY